MRSSRTRKCVAQNRKKEKESGEVFRIASSREANACLAARRVTLPPPVSVRTATAPRVDNRLSLSLSLPESAGDTETPARRGGDDIKRKGMKRNVVCR